MHLWKFASHGVVQSHRSVEHAHEGELESVVFQPCARREEGQCLGDLVLATGGDDGFVRLWDPETGWMAVEPPLTGHTDSVRTVAFSPDGQILASAGDDGTIRLWNVTDGRPLGAPLEGHTMPVRSIAFYPNQDSLLLVSVGTSEDRSGSEIWRWSLGSDELIDRACRLAGRGLTEEEWTRYINGVDPAAETREKSESNWNSETVLIGILRQKTQDFSDKMTDELNKRLNRYEETCPVSPRNSPTTAQAVPQYPGSR